MSAEIRRVLCTTDFSAAANKAVRQAVRIAQQLGAEVHLLHAYPVPSIPSPAGGDFSPQQLTAQLAESAETEMRREVREWNKRQISVVPHVAAGPPADVIVETAKEIGADMIVVGTHGRTGLAHLLIGSVAERVIRTATVPVVTIRTA